MAMFCKKELLRLSNKKFHNNDVKSVRKRSEALIAQWRSYIVLVITLIQITDKRQKAFGIFPSSGRSTNENNTARDHCKVSFPAPLQASLLAPAYLACVVPGQQRLFYHYNHEVNFSAMQFMYDFV